MLPEGRAGLECGAGSQYIAQVVLPSARAIRAFWWGVGNRLLGFIGRNALGVLPPNGSATIKITLKRRKSMSSRPLASAYADSVED